MSRSVFPDPRATLFARFWTKVEMNNPDDCWLWTGFVNNQGYGRIKLGRKVSALYAHRVAVLLSGRDIPAGMIVHHRCGVRRCVNPDHLVVTTMSENNRRFYKDPLPLLLVDVSPESQPRC